MNTQTSGQTLVNLQAIFKPHGAAILRGKARRINKRGITFLSADQPVIKRDGQLLILLAPAAPGTEPEVVEAECAAMEVVHACNTIRVEFKVLRWSDNGRLLFERIGLKN